MRSTIAVLVVIVAGALTGGCGSSSSSDATTGAQSKPSALSYTQCMRDHGVQMSDPDPSTGVPKLDPSVKASSPAVKTALSACQKLLPAGVRQAGDTQDLTAYLAFSKCMRANGLPDFPDPSPSSEGLFPDSGVDRNSPAFKQAASACQDVLAKVSGNGG